MTATNHALTGASIGLWIANPLLALPLAFLSHFALDALPHFASKRWLPEDSRRFVYYLAAEAGVCAAIVLSLVVLQPQNWFWAALCAFVATSPDFMWVQSFLASQRKAAAPKRKHWVVKFHSWVQWYQKEPGIIFEIIWAVAMLLALANLAAI